MIEMPILTLDVSQRALDSLANASLIEADCLPDVILHGNDNESHAIDTVGKKRRNAARNLGSYGSGFLCP